MIDARPSINRADLQRAVYVYPSDARARATFKDRLPVYRLLWDYYTNRAFEDLVAYFRYIGKYGLYDYTRQIFNPVTRVVDFYAEHVYGPGVFTTDAEDSLPRGVRSSIPLHPNTSTAIRNGLRELWRWSNWSANCPVMITYAALTGNCAVEIVDNLTREKVYKRVWWPEEVTDLELNEAGDVTEITFEYMTSTPDRRFKSGERLQRYRKVLSKAGIAEYVEDRKVDERENPYGFVPVTWVQHISLGGLNGVPAIRSSIGKIDHCNSDASHAADYLHKRINSARILWTDSKIRSAFAGEYEEDAQGNPIGGAVREEYDARYDVAVLQGKPGGNTESLLDDLDAASVGENITRQLDELKEDYPELSAWKLIREMSAITGPAVDRSLGDVRGKMHRPATNYDAANVKSDQQALAIGGWRTRNGWGANGRNPLTAQQRAFGEFDLTSYDKGQLDFSILPRPLVPLSSSEAAEEQAFRFQAAQSADALGLPKTEVCRVAGYSETEAQRFALQFAENPPNPDGDEDADNLPGEEDEE